MNISVIVPQVFYDLIARILPGAFFSILAVLSFPEWAGYVSPLASTDKNNLVQSLGQGSICLSLCYFLGWLFYAFSSGSRREETRKRHEDKRRQLTMRRHKKGRDAKSLDVMYQWIRLAQPSAGFRVVKLRAEARMFQATRTGMVVLGGLAVVYILGALPCLGLLPWRPGSAFWLKPAVGLLIAGVVFFGFGRCEGRAWDYYWANICIVYDALHDTDDPIPPGAGRSSDT